MNSKTLSTIISLMVSTTVWAESSDHRDHDAHVHGHAALNLAISGKDLQLELRSPAMNLLGFEHQATSAQDKRQVKDTVQFLRQTGQWIGLEPSANCQLQQVDVNSGQLEHDDHHHHGHHDPIESQHSDFEVNISFQCQRSERLKQIDLSGLFAHFPGFEELEVQWITDSTQSATELNRRQSVINLD